MDALGLFGGSSASNAASSGNPQMIKFKEAISEYENAHDCKIIFIDHFEEKTSLMGSYLYGSTPSLSRDDAMKFVKELRQIPSDKDIDIIMHTTGGSLFAAETILNAIFSHKGEVRVHIPYYACSAGTLIALAAKKIIMHDHSYIGPVDPQYAMGVSASSLTRFEESGSSSWVEDIVKLVKSDSVRAMKRVDELVKGICLSNPVHTDAALICKELASGKYDHDQPIFYRDIQEKNLLENVSNDFHEKIMEIFDQRKSLLSK